MEDRNCELLFQYLKSILYDTKIQKLDVAELDEPYQRFGNELQLLQYAVERMQAYAEELFQAFYTMSRQLKAQEALLSQETKEEKRQAEIAENYSELLLELMRKSNEWILVVDRDERKILYCNRQEQKSFMDEEFCRLCDKNLNCRQRILDWKDGDMNKTWEFQAGDRKFYQAVTFAVNWRGKDAYAHVIRDMTEEKQRAELLISKAYQDPLTGINNRLYFKECMEMILKSGVPFCFCFMDLDGLKRINDMYGHLEGDAYLCGFVNLIRDRFQENDLFARVGGDEFCLVLKNGSKETVLKRLEDICREFRAMEEKEYITSFSYGVIEIDRQSEGLSVEEVLGRADAVMYQRKKRNKENMLK